MKPFQLFRGAQTHPSRPKPFRVTIFLMVLCLALAGLSPAWAKDGALDPSFNPGLGVTNIPILFGPTYYNDGSGKVLICGYFTGLNGTNRTGLARLNSDGTLDGTFNAAIDGMAYHAILLTPTSADSQILVYGDFSIPSGNGTYYGLARLNHDGSVDTSFAHTFTSAQGLLGFGMQSDGKIVMGGYAMSVTGYPGHTYYLLRLNADGTVDGTYSMREGSGALVRGIQINQGDYSARLLGVIPRVSDPGHVDYTVVVNSSGTPVAGTNLGDETLNGPILGMAWDSYGKVIIVGSFNQVYGTAMNGVARLNSGMGSLDTSFNIGTGANGLVQGVNFYGDQIVLAGDFTSFNGVPCGHLVRLNYNGSVDGTFNSGTGADDRIWNMFRKGDGTWEILGAFQHYNGVPRQCIADLAADGSLNSQFSNVTLANAYPAVVYTIQQTSQGTLIAGKFTGYNGKLHRCLVRVNDNGTVDNSFKCPGVFTGIKSISIQTDNKILIAGSFVWGFGYTPLTGIARVNSDGSLDRTFKPSVVKGDGSWPDLSLVARAWDASGHILVGGDFAKVNGVARSGIVRLNSDGSLDNTFDFDPSTSMPGLTNVIVNASSDDEGKGFKVGGKATYSSSDSGFFARLNNDGSLDTNFANDPSPVAHVVVFNGEVRCGTGDETGQIILGGDFTQVLDGAANPQRNHIARFTHDGSLDTSFVPLGTDGPIYSLQTQYTQQYATNKILIGGAFTSCNGVARNNLARIRANGSLDTSFNPGAGPNGAVWAIWWDNYNFRALIGGAFTTYAGVNRSRIARIVAGNGSFNPAIPMLLLK